MPVHSWMEEMMEKERRVKLGWYNNIKRRSRFKCNLCHHTAALYLFLALSLSLSFALLSWWSSLSHYYLSVGVVAVWLKQQQPALYTLVYVNHIMIGFILSSSFRSAWHQHTAVVVEEKNITRMRGAQLLAFHRRPSMQKVFQYVEVDWGNWINSNHLRLSLEKKFKRKPNYNLRDWRLLYWYYDFSLDWLVRGCSQNM